MGRIQTMVLTGALMVLVGAPGAAAQSDVRVDDDDITVTGCVGRPDQAITGAQDVLVWTRGDIMLASAHAAGDTFNLGGPPGPFFYWLDDDDDLAGHFGRLVEVQGELGDFEEGEIEIDRDDDFTEITVEIDGDEETARIPTAWLGGASDDVEYDIVTRRIDVDEVRDLGPCPQP